MILQADSQPSQSHSALAAQVEAIFGPGGLLSKAKNFEHRVPQQKMAVAVARALEAGENLVVEAGTGVGKSLAYLIPAILFGRANGRKAVVSTHTINLQEQLAEKDLPMLQAILPVEFSFTMLKGRANYLCTRRLQRALARAEGLFTTPEVAELKRVYEWSRTTEDGSLSDFDVEPDAKVWEAVCSERGLCSPKLCGHGSDAARSHGECFFQQARRRFLSADVLVLNHSLFFASLGVLANDDDEEEDAGEGLLFKNDFVIFDEAQHLQPVASRHIGVSVSSGAMRFNLHRLWNPRTEKGLLATLREGAVVKGVAETLEEADKLFGEVEKACDGLHEKGPRRQRDWRELRIRQADLVEDTVSLPLQRVREAVGGMIEAAEDEETAAELIECNRRLAELRDAVSIFLSQCAEDHVYWVERTGRMRQGLSLNAAPIDIAEYLRGRVFYAGTSAVCTSATLAIKDPERDQAPPGKCPGLDFFVRGVGAENARRAQMGSPFNYQKQVKLYVAGRMPDPRDEAYAEALVEWVGHFVKKTHGKAFVLFTNSKLMKEVAAELEPLFAELGIACIVQGTGTPRATMLEQFKEDTDSVLFGLDSFWQGVDVPGEALSNVVITRLPFAVPDHPLIEACVEAIEAKGGNAFMEFNLPMAVLKFRQGVGRLIRTADDSGIIAVLDNRVLTKRYGRMFIDSLPEMELEVV
ncbi:MAG: ATP-dependent helicase [Verrucomicrobiales bacterium]|nr:ATP-dependent helicase [Verrucomicrobiales bacterium]|tara:strand:- start:14167 stop:16254 length:2088 start_codon:yes stop_codon:yes gene_type:complete